MSGDHRLGWVDRSEVIGGVRPQCQHLGAEERCTGTGPCLMVEPEPHPPADLRKHTHDETTMALPTPEWERRQVALTPTLALQILAARPCETTTGGRGCMEEGRSPVAKFGAYQACAPCIARAGLDGRP